MACNHKHIVIHRDDVERHDIREGLEANCSCGPGLLCPVCDWSALYHECFVMAPSAVVDANLAAPPADEVN